MSVGQGRVDDAGAGRGGGVRGMFHHALEAGPTFTSSTSSALQRKRKFGDTPCARETDSRSIAKYRYSSLRDGAGEELF